MGRERHSARLVTLSFVTLDSCVLLLRHPDHGDRFAGQWNGVGGHVEEGECIRAAARRELREETGLDVPELVLRGVVHESGLLGNAHVLFVFTGVSRQRDVRSPEGLELCWQPIAEIGALPLVHDTALLLERALGDGEPFFAVERYDGGDSRIELRADGGDGGMGRG